MGIVIRQSAIATGLSYVGVVIGYVNLLILFPMYMSPEEVGLSRIIQDAAMLLVPFAQLGTNQVIVRYFPEHKNKSQYGEFVAIVFSLLILTLALFAVLFFIFKSSFVNYFSAQSPQVSDYLNYILGLTFILAIYQIMVAFSQSSLNIVLPNFLKEVLLRTITLIGIVLFTAQLISFQQFINLIIGAYGLNLLILIIYLGRQGMLKVEFKRSYFNTATIRKMITFMLFTFLGASGILIIGKVDSLMVTGMIGLEATAIYTTAFYIAVLIELPKRAVSQISIPLISRAFKDENLKDISDIYRKSAINNLIIGILIFIGLWINLDSIFSLIPRTEVYALGSMVVVFVGAGKLIDMAAGLNGEIIIMSKYYKVNVYLIMALAFFTVVANYFLIPIYGLNGAAIGSAFALLFFNLSKFVFLYGKLNLQPFSLNTIKVLILGGIVLVIGFWLPKIDNVYLDIFYRSAIVTVIYAVAIYLLKPSDDINNLVNKVIRLKK
jgi:O-antigen/teichoic acid export membrane protein